MTKRASGSAFDRADIDLFLALADLERLDAAARAVGVHHATAFRRLEDLEAKIGARLFERLGGDYRLTAAGRALVDPARQLRGQLLEFDSRVRHYDAALAGRVSLTSSDGLALGYLPELLTGFAALYPEISVELRVENAISDLAAREIDVALRPAKRLTGNMVGRKAATMGYALYAAPGYLKKRPLLDAQAPDLSGHDVIGYDASMSFYSTAQWLARHARRARMPVCANSLHAMLALARAGAGVAALPCVIADPAAGLARIGAPLESMATSLWVCTHPDLRKVARVRALVDFLFEAVRRDGARLSGAS